MPRRNMIEMADLILDAIPVNSTGTLTDIAFTARVDWRTAKRWIDVFMKIQGFPEIVEEQIGEQVGYRRKTKAGRPKKK